MRSKAEFLNAMLPKPASGDILPGPDSQQPIERFLLFFFVTKDKMNPDTVAFAMF